jgi:hypothetical protein
VCAAFLSLLGMLQEKTEVLQATCWIWVVPLVLWGAWVSPTGWRMNTTARKPAPGIHASLWKHSLTFSQKLMFIFYGKILSNTHVCKPHTPYKLWGYSEAQQNYSTKPDETHCRQQAFSGLKPFQGSRWAQKPEFHSPQGPGTQVTSTTTPEVSFHSQEVSYLFAFLLSILTYVLGFSLAQATLDSIQPYSHRTQGPWKGTSRKSPDRKSPWINSWLWPSS